MKYSLRASSKNSLSLVVWHSDVWIVLCPLCFYITLNSFWSSCVGAAILPICAINLYSSEPFTEVPFHSWNDVVRQPAVLALLWPFHCHRITALIAHNEKSKVRKGRRLILLCWNIIPCEWGISISVNKDEVGCIVLKPDLSPLSLHPWPLSCVVYLSAFEPTEPVHYCCTTQSLHICCTYLRTDSPIFFRAAVAIACFNMREMQYTY